jgi:hypothetical protein
MTYKKEAADIFKKRLLPKQKAFVRYLENLDRIKIVFFVFVFYCLIIIVTSFKYDFMEFNYYSKLAE